MKNGALLSISFEFIGTFESVLERADRRTCLLELRRRRRHPPVFILLYTSVMFLMIYNVREGNVMEQE